MKFDTITIIILALGISFLISGIQQLKTGKPIGIIDAEKKFTVCSMHNYSVITGVIDFFFGIYWIVDALFFKNTVSDALSNTVPVLLIALVLIEISAYFLILRKRPQICR